MSIVCCARSTRRETTKTDPPERAALNGIETGDQPLAEAHNPLEQFQIRRIVPIELGGLDASFTNSSVFMIVAVALVTLLMVFGMSRRALVPGRWQSAAELSYEFIASMVRDNVGDGGKQYFPFIFSLFMFILLCNLLGMVPYSFTPTSHIIVTLAMAVAVFIGVTVIGFAKHGLGFLSIFAPAGVPTFMLLILIPIEIISYLIRPLTLAVRLFANMLAGHIMLKLFGGFILLVGWFGFWLPLGFIVALTGLEILVAFLQAYVFAILTCIYLNDAVNMHH